MSNQTLLLQKLGFNTEEIDKEGFDIEKAVSEFNDKQLDVFKNRADILQPLKDQVKTEASIIATKKAKKAIVKAYGLGYSDSELADIDVETLLEQAKESTKNTAEVAELQQKIINLTNEYNAKVEAKELELKEKEANLLADLKSEKVNSILNTTLFNETEYLIDKNLVTNIFLTGIKADGLDIDPTKEGVLIKTKDGFEVLTEDNKSKVDLDYLKNKYLSGIIKKSNGSGGNPNPAERKVVDDEILKNIPEAMRANLARLQN